MKAFIEGEFLQDEKNNITAYEMISSIFLARSVMGFIEEELLYDKRRN
jgi:hypothetical protein